MIARLFFAAAAFLLLIPSVRAAGENQQNPQNPPHPSIISRILHPFRHSPKPADTGTEVKVRNIKLRLDVSPIPLKLSETREARVTLVVTNDSKKLVHLAFPTTQRIEVLVRNQSGKQLTQWSEDQSFENETTYVAIDPGERIEYSVNMPTRDMTAGEPCTIEAFLPAYADLKAVKSVTPEK